MAENKKQNRWTINLDDVVNFRNELLEDKFVEVPAIYVEKDEPKKEVFTVELKGYGNITISAASGKFTFVPYAGIADESTKFSKRFFSKGSFMKVAEEFVTSHLELQPIEDEQTEEDDLADAMEVEDEERAAKNEPQKPANTQTVMDRPHAFLNMATGELLDQNKKPIKTKYDEKAPKLGKDGKEHGKNALGHIKNSMADLLDKLFLEGVTEEELLEHGITRARYRSHFRHLENDKMELVQVKFENGKYSAMLLN